MIYMKALSSKKITIYALFTAASILFGYVEYLLPLNFIAPGVKLGMANGIFLVLLLSGNFGAAFIINVVRILLSALLFATPFSLLFSLSAGIVSSLFMWVLSKSKRVGFIGISVAGGAAHNITQLLIARLTVGGGVWFYTPFLLVTGLIAGMAVGFLSWLVFGRIKNLFKKI